MSNQSQSDFLEEVMTWDKQTCLDNVETALPRAISKLQESAFIEESIGILKIICHSFLPCVQSEELEDRLFSHVCQLICGFVDVALNKITMIVGEQRSTQEEVKAVVVECLEWLMDTVDCVEGCVRHVLSLSGSVELSYVQSLPACAVYVLKEAYTHCKNSTSLYGDVMELIAEPLSLLFKRTHSLQMAFVNMLDKVCITGAQLEDHVQVLCSVCTGLFNICGIISSLNVKLVISLWKALVKVCSQHISLLRDRFDVCPLISLLCDEVKQGYKYLFELCPWADPGSLSQGDDKTFIKSSKILGFQMKVIVALLRDFTNYLGDCERNVLELLLFLHRYLPPSMCAPAIPAKLESEVRSQIVNATAPILGHLVGSRVFRSALTATTEERSSEDRLPQLLLQLLVLDMLPKCEADVIDAWLSPNNHSTGVKTRGLLSAIFESVQLCEVEMRMPVMLPGVMVAGKPQRQVSLYEHTATHICGFIGACPAKHFSVLELTLLENALKDSHLASLLASDCWCYLARYCTASVCRNQVQALVAAFQQLSKENVKSAHKLKSLVQRLIKFMSPEHQSELVKQYSPVDVPRLWVALTSSCLNDDLATSVRQSLVPWGLSVLQGTQMKVLDVFSSITLFTDILSDSSMGACMSAQQQVMLASSVCNMWAHIQATNQEVHPSRPDLLLKLLYLTKHLLPLMDPVNISTVLTVVLSSITTTSDRDTALAASHLLSGFGALRMPSSSQLSNVLNRLSQVFHTLMTHPDLLVQHYAVVAYAQFARETVYDETIAACLQENEMLSRRIELLQNQVPYQTSQIEFVISDYLKSQISEAQEELKAAKALTEDTTIGARYNSENKAETSKPEADASDEDSAEDSVDRPAKRAKLSATSPDASAPPTMEVAAERPTPVAESTQSPKYRALLESLSLLAQDIELECRSGSLPPPPWFTDAARDAVTRISSCISPNNNWFDGLS